MVSFFKKIFKTYADLCSFSLAAVNGVALCCSAQASCGFSACASVVGALRL